MVPPSCVMVVLVFIVETLPLRIVAMVHGEHNIPQRDV